MTELRPGASTSPRKGEVARDLGFLSTPMGEPTSSAWKRIQCPSWQSAFGDLQATTRLFPRHVFSNENRTDWQARPLMIRDVICCVLPLETGAGRLRSTPHLSDPGATSLPLAVHELSLSLCSGCIDLHASFVAAPVAVHLRSVTCSQMGSRHWHQYVHPTAV